MFTRVLAALGAILLLALAATPAEARWFRAESKKFIVYSDSDEASLRRFVINLEDYDAILRDQTMVPQDRESSRKLEIYLVRDRDDLQVVEPGLSEGIAGFYAASMYDIYAIASMPKSDHDDFYDDVVFHEYAHHFMLLYLPGRYPGWYVEGFAEYFAPIDMKDGSFVVGGVNQGRAATLLNEKWIPIEDLLNKRPLEFDTGDEQSAYYAQAWLLTHYMMADPARRRQLVQYVAALRADKKSSETWTQVTGDTMPALTQKLQDYKKKGRLAATSWTRREKRKPADMVITRLPPSSDDFLLLGQRMKGRLSEEEGKTVLADVRKRASQYPGDRLADLTLARAELWYGDFAKGRAVIDGLLAKNPSDAAALQLLGMALVDKGEEDSENEEKLFKEARKYLARAYQADNDDYRTMVYFTQTQQIERDYPNQNTLDLLSESFVRAPQVADVRLLLARGMMRNKRWDEATILLTPLANDPHGGGAAETAQGLLRQIKANR
jgi:Flp pilus assembly protein TadD